MRDLGKGLGTIGIWLGVGIAGYNGNEMVEVVAVSGMVATWALWMFGSQG